MLLTQLEDAPQKIREAVRAAKIAEEEPVKVFGVRQQIQEAKNQEQKANIENIKVLCKYLDKFSKEMQAHINNQNILEAIARWNLMNTQVENIGTQLVALGELTGLPELS
jgi:vacuolar-type H+-ATPase subunit I/STV1